MARMARLVVPNLPHHVTQRGNRRQKTFFSADDYRAYVELLSEAKETAGIAIWAYCLMPNHTHLVVVPRDEDSLAALFAEAHRRYTRRVNLREGWQGHLWQERFHSFVMDEPHLLATVRYIELNPVRAGLCESAQQWPWSSASAHLAGKDDALVTVAPMLGMIDNWGCYLESAHADAVLKTIRQHTKTGRPAGDAGFITQLEELSGRALHTQKRGPKARIK